MQTLFFAYGKEHVDPYYTLLGILKCENIYTHFLHINLRMTKATPQLYYWIFSHHSYVYVIDRLGGPYREKLWHFQVRAHSFFTIRTDPKPNNNIFTLFSCSKLVYKRVCLRNLVNELGYAPSTNHSCKKI